MTRGDRRPKGITVHRSRTLHRRDVTVQWRIRVTSAARALLDCAPTLKSRSRAVNEARHARLTTPAQIAELDSWEFHQDRSVFESDRERDAAHLAQGVPTVRITWERLTARPAREAKSLDQILTSIDTRSL